MTQLRFIDHFIGPDTHTNRPAANAVNKGTKYVCTTHGTIDSSDGATWTTWATLGGSGVVETIVAGTNVTVDSTDPANPIVSSSGGGGAFVGCKAVRSTSQTLTTSGTYYAVAFNAADEYDSDSLHDTSTNNSRITVPTGMDGVWRFTSAATFAANGTGLRETAFYVNGTIVTPTGNVRAISAGSGETTRLTASGDLLLTAGQYVELFARQTSTASLDVTAAAMSAVYLGAP